MLAHAASVAAAALPFQWVSPLVIVFGGILNNRRVANPDPLIWPKPGADQLTAKPIVTDLNHYELIAVGAFTGIPNERFYSRWMRTTIVEDWAITKAFIPQVRLRPSSALRRFYARRRP